MRTLLAFAILIWAPCAQAANISVALTNDRIEVDTGFAGARFTLFGAVTGVENPSETIDIITVIRGPASRFLIRRMEKRNFIWTPGATQVIDGAPGLYLTNSTRPIDEIATIPDQEAFRLGADHLKISTNARDIETEIVGPDASHLALYKNAFLTEIEEMGHYNDAVGGVTFKKDSLFTVDVDLPGTTPVGDYTVAVYLYQNGILLGQDNAALRVNKVGIEREIYNLAHERPVTYGILCVVISLVAGWAAAFAFRKP